MKATGRENMTTKNQNYICHFIGGGRDWVDGCLCFLQTTKATTKKYENII